jgi:hypothetical protein
MLLLLLAQSAFAGVRGESELKNVKIPKPEVAIIMNKQNLTPKYDLELKQSFLPKVVASVQTKPF